MSEELKPCPCGKVPLGLGISDNGQGGKYAVATPECCGVWDIEFHTMYLAQDSEECMDLAIEAWNEAPRTNTQEVEQLRKSHAIELQCLMEEKDNEYAQLRKELELQRRAYNNIERVHCQSQTMLKQERDELAAHVERLREGLRLTNTHRGHFGEEPWISNATALALLAETPDQSLQHLTDRLCSEHDNEVIERCAVNLEKASDGGQVYEGLQFGAHLIRALKTEEGK